MPTLFPPEYPDRPDAPLLSFGPSFSEDLARSVIQAIGYDEEEEPHETETRIAAALTMLEAFHPRDQLECMLAAQGVAAYHAIMDSFRRAMFPATEAMATIKHRATAVQLSRMFSSIMRDLERRQGKPLPERPPASSPPPAGPNPGGPAGGTPSGDPPASAEPATPARDNRLAEFDAAPEVPEDIETRPDGTPGSLSAYAPKPPAEPYIPREAAITLALATRPSPWKMVNVPGEKSKPANGLDASAPAGPAAVPADAPAAHPATRGLLDLKEDMFAGDALARFASARLDPAAPVEPLRFDDDEAVVELELISTGGDPEAEAEHAALIAAHPEGKPIVTLRYGTKRPPDS